MFVEEYNHAFEKANIDMIIGPTTIGEEPPKIKDILGKTYKSNPIFEYKMDYYTIFPNAAGIPAITMPFHEDPQKYQFPSSVKLHGYFGEDYHLLRIALQVETMLKEHGVDEKNH